MNGLNRKTVIWTAVIAAAAVAVGGIYIFFSGDYSGRNKITLTEDVGIDYEFLNIASENGIVGDYVFARTTELMIGNSSDGVMIPSSYMIEGRLTTQPAESSEVYLLSDQARLLDLYVRRGDMFAASSLRTRVNETLLPAEEDIGELSSYLRAYLRFYSTYGKKSDLAVINDIVERIFGDDGRIDEYPVSVAGYVEADFLSLADPSGYEGEEGTLFNGDQNDPVREITGIKLSDIDLRLIRDLEENGFIPEGTYGYYRDILTGGIASDSIPLYAYAFNYTDDGQINYVYSGNRAAAVDMYGSVVTMMHLAETDDLDGRSYTWIRNSIINGNPVLSCYSLYTGRMEGDEVFAAYPVLMRTAVLRGDTDLFLRVCARVGSRVATYSSSSALSMIYRQDSERFVFYADENLRIAEVLTR